MERNRLKLLSLLTLRAWPGLAGLLAAIFPERPDAVYDQARWDAEYDVGGWAHLAGAQEAARNQVIASLQARLRPGAAILDIGCGEGVLARSLLEGRYRSYLGIDLSSVAVARAAAQATQAMRFEVAEGASFDTTERFDVIVFNESLYYFDQPVEAVERYATFLAPDGVLLISMALCGMRDGLRKLAIWRALKARFRTMDEIELVRRPMPVWLIGAFGGPEGS